MTRQASLFGRVARGGRSIDEKRAVRQIGPPSCTAGYLARYYWVGGTGQDCLQGNWPSVRIGQPAPWVHFA